MNRQAQIKLQQYEKIEMEQAHARGQFLKYGERVLALEEEYEAVAREVLGRLVKPEK